MHELEPRPRGARPNIAAQERLLGLLRTGVPVDEALTKAGVNFSGLRYWRKHVPDWWDREAAARGIQRRDTTGRKSDFLAALAIEGNIAGACRRARVSPASVFRWRSTDPGFAEMCQDLLR